MGAVTDKITEEIAGLRVDETAPGLAQVAIRLAESMDGNDGPTAIANAATALRAVMIELHKLAPVETKGDAVDDIAEQREKRREEARRKASGG